MSDYRKGFRDGWMAAREAAQEAVGRGFIDIDKPSDADIAFSRGRFPESDWPRSQKPKRKRSQSPKQKLLSSMADKAWKSYKRKTPKGKKTYIAIRAQVSRSQAYKKKARRL